LPQAGQGVFDRFEACMQRLHGLLVEFEFPFQEGEPDFGFLQTVVMWGRGCGHAGNVIARAGVFRCGGRAGRREDDPEPVRSYYL